MPDRFPACVKAEKVAREALDVAAIEVGGEIEIVVDFRRGPKRPIVAFPDNRLDARLPEGGFQNEALLAISGEPESESRLPSPLIELRDGGRRTTGRHA